MRSRITTIAIAAAGLLVSVAFGWVAHLEHRVTAKPQVIDYGQLLQGAVVEAEFRVTNCSLSTVKLYPVYPNCECGTATIDRSELRPLAAATVRGKWELGGRRGSVTTELVVPYQFGDGPAHYLTLELRADVVPDVELSALSLSFDGKRPGEEVLRFAPRDGVAVTSARASHEAFVARLDAAARTVVVVFDPTKWDGRAAAPDARLNVLTTSTAEPYIFVPLLVREYHP